MDTIATIKTILHEGSAVIGDIGLLCLAISHLPLPAKWAERFARFAAYTSQRFSVNDRKASS